MYHLWIDYRPNWINIYGQEYHRSAFIQCGWQAQDEGINEHLAAYSIIHAHSRSIIHLPSLASVLFTHFSL